MDRLDVHEAARTGQVLYEASVRPDGVAVAVAFKVDRVTKRSVWINTQAGTDRRDRHYSRWQDLVGETPGEAVQKAIEVYQGMAHANYKRASEYNEMAEGQERQVAELKALARKLEQVAANNLAPVAKVEGKQ